jgi:hypothetical protein
VFRLFDGLESIELHNNVFYKSGGGAITLLRDSHAKWKRGQIIGGSNNWITSGSAIPKGLTNTLQGPDPGFVDYAGLDLRPSSNSPLAGAANTSPQTLSEAPFTSPAPPPGDDIGASPASHGLHKVGAERTQTATAALTIDGADDATAETDETDGNDEAVETEETEETEEASEAMSDASAAGMACSAAPGSPPRGLAAAATVVMAALAALGIRRGRRARG